MEPQLKSEVVHIRVSPEVLKKIKRQAEKDGRTVSGLLSHLLSITFK